jgi:hypothetical protein
VAKSNVATLEHPTYSPDLPATGFYLFPPLKSALEGWHFCDATSIIRNATEELKRLSQNGRNIPNTFLFAGSSVVAQNDCFEGNVASLIVLFFYCISQN